MDEGRTAPPSPDRYIDEVFGSEGYLSQRFEGYRPRTGQVALARIVDQGIRDGRHVLAEGPTGTGKSIGYAVPASWHAAHQGRNVVIVTANIALQEQLIRKDLPLLAEILPWDFSYSMLKGKGNYLCVDKYYKDETENVQGQLGGSYQPNYEEEDQLQSVKAWALETIKLGTQDADGDVSELPFEPMSNVWRRFSVSNDECKGKDCRLYDECFAAAAQRRAKDAMVVVTNYHLLFAHLQVQRLTDGNAGILPNFDICIMDEAHKAADIARDFFGFRITHEGIKRIVRKLGKDSRVGLDVIDASTHFFSMLASFKASPEYKTRLKKPLARETSWRKLDDALDAAHVELNLKIDEMGRLGSEDREARDSRAEMKKAAERAGLARANIEMAMTLDEEEEQVYFIDTDLKNRSAICSKPIDVAPIVREMLFKKSRCVVVTSATLAIGDSFEYVAGELGCDSHLDLVAESPFDFRKQALLIVPDGMPEPQAKEFADFVAEAFNRIVHLANGRTLGLFTSNRVMNRAHELVRHSGFRILKQGDRPRSQLIEEFKNDTHSVLMGVQSFWAGVDVPGESLSCVVIDRLPFPTPEDPILDAITERDRNWFAHYSIPRSIVEVKQGFGRLIRATTDRGVVVILDRRIIDKGYGAKFIRSLPDVMKTRRLEAVQEFLGEPAIVEPAAAAYDPFDEGADADESAPEAPASSVDPFAEDADNDIPF